MFENLNEKDKKTLTMGVVAVLGLVVMVLGYFGYSTWEQKKSEYDAKDKDIKTLNLTDSAYNNLLATVPIFQMPLDQETQKNNFRDSLSTLFDDLRISTELWVEVPANKAERLPVGYGKLCLKTSTSGNCSFQSILNLLAALKENPYLAGIEEFKITCDPQNPQSASLSLVLSTFTNNRNNKRTK